jgi:hypothetical protein
MVINHNEYGNDPQAGLTRHGSAPEAGAPVDPFAAAVVIPTIFRASLDRAITSVFNQDIKKRCQLLVGIDKVIGDFEMPSILRKLPDNWSLTVLNLGYSTSVRHGGIHKAKDGGALRTILSYAAHSRYVAYLDDDNWWGCEHLSSLGQSIQGADYAYSFRWFVDPKTQNPLVVDQWESVGPGRGVYARRFDGFVDPNTLMIDKTKCEDILRFWTLPLPGDTMGTTADRQVFHALQKSYRGIATNKPTVFYVMDPDDTNHQARLHHISRRSARYPDWE